MTSSTWLRFCIAGFCFINALLPIFGAVIVCSLIVLFRSCLSIYLSRKHGQPITLLEPKNSFHSLNLGNHGPMLQMYNILKGSTDFQEVKERIRKNLVFAMNGDGSWKYPRLRCRIAKSFSYFYWLPEENFNLDGHVALHGGTKPKNYDELFALFKTTRRTQPLESPFSWYMQYVTLADDFEGLDRGPHFAILMDFDHSLADAVSWTWIYRDALMEDTSRVVTSQRRQRKNCKFIHQIRKTLHHIFYTPLIGLIILWKHRDSNILHGPSTTGTQLVKTSPISIGQLRKIRDSRKLQVTTNDIIVSSVAASLRRYFATHGNKEIPKYITIAIPTSDYQPSSDLTHDNSTTIMFVNVALTEETALGLLKSTSRSISEAKDSTELWLTTIIYNNNYLPAWIAGIGLYSVESTCIVSNVPAFPNQYSLADSQHVTMGFMPHSRGRMAVAVSIMLNSGSLELNVGIDSSIGMQKDLEEIVAGFHEALEELETSSDTKKYN